MVILKELSGDLVLGHRVIEGDLQSTDRELGGAIIQNGARSSPTYHGTYELTPSNETQILEVKGMRMDENITVNPVPSNYGLISWNGSELTVS